MRARGLGLSHRIIIPKRNGKSYRSHLSNFTIIWSRGPSFFVRRVRTELPILGSHFTIGWVGRTNLCRRFSSPGYVVRAFHQKEPTPIVVSLQLMAMAIGTGFPKMVIKQRRTAVVTSPIGSNLTETTTRMQQRVLPSAASEIPKMEKKKHTHTATHGNDGNKNKRCFLLSRDEDPRTQTL
ncbi:hypothetical protein EDB92DRAFT_1033699 [Lactarius akahatsu]|uniref:Uncharacterized protein n=1 Tax=Lactarius akahatsu TaxID=416441 RepID=A0AAD4LC39_9AGAM|nr:hypothetical protein EDB92DRAFT_1033699 [Lactarius akahatsu]